MINKSPIGYFLKELPFIIVEWEDWIIAMQTAQWMRNKYEFYTF